MAQWRKKKAKLGTPALDLEAKLGKEPPASCYLVTGEEGFLRDEALRALREGLIGENPGPSYRVFDGPKADLAEVLDEARTMPFLGASHRVVVVRDAAKTAQGKPKSFLTAHAEALLTYLKNPPDTSTLVLLARKVDRRLKVTKQLEKAAAVVDCSPFDDAGLLRFLRQRAKRWGRPFAKGADLALLERLGGQEVALSLIDAEVHKLAAAGEGPITPVEVESLASFGSNEDSFALIDRIAQGDVEGALTRLRTMWRDGLVAGGGDKTRDPTGIAMILLPTLRWDLTRLFKARTLLDRGTRPFDVTKQLRVFRDKQHFLRRVRRASRGELARRHAVLRAADGALRSSGDPRGTLSDAVVTLALAEQDPAARRPARSARR